MLKKKAMQKAWQSFRDGRLGESRRIVDQLLMSKPADSDLRLLDGLIHARQGRYRDAEASLTAALNMQRSYSALVALGEVYLNLGEAERSEPLFLEAIEQQADAPQIRNALAHVFAVQYKYAEALEQYQWLLDKGGANAQLLGNMAVSLEMLRKSDEARRTAMEALRLDSTNPVAHLVLARLNRAEQRLEESIPRLREAIGFHRSSIHGSDLLNELGHVLDLSEEYEQAFEAFINSKRIWGSYARQAPFGKDFYLRRIQDFHELLSGETRVPDPVLGGSIPRLVFFVGFPRSGTTLMEQMLKTQPMVVTTQEEPLVNSLVAQLTDNYRHAAAYPALIDRLSDMELDELRSQYLNGLRRVTGAEGCDSLYIDKNPLNLVETLFIHRLFPSARFLIALRDPRDVCLSCVMQPFQVNPATIHFQNMEDTSRFYVETMGLWQHCKAVLEDLTYLEYRYEDLISDFDTVSKRILEFVGVDWTSDIQDFHRHASANAVHTPSYIDVASPLYSRAVGRWKNYENQIADVAEKLQPFVHEFGYT